MDSLSFLESFYISNTFEKRFGISMEIKTASVLLSSGLRGRKGKSRGEGACMCLERTEGRVGADRNCSHITQREGSATILIRLGLLVQPSVFDSVHKTTHVAHTNSRDTNDRTCEWAMPLATGRLTEISRDERACDGHGARGALSNIHQTERAHGHTRRFRSRRSVAVPRTRLATRGHRRQGSATLGMAGFVMITEPTVTASLKALACSKCLAYRWVHDEDNVVRVDGLSDLLHLFEERRLLLVAPDVSTIMISWPPS